MRIGVYASALQYAHHIRPIWDALNDDERAGWLTGQNYYLPTFIIPDAWLTACIRDYRALINKVPKKKYFYMEHGTGLQAHSASGIKAMNQAVTISMVPNKWTEEEIREAGFEGRVEIIGTPKMDELINIPNPENDIIALSFHWTGNAQNFLVWRSVIKRLRNKFHFIGHSHPHVWQKMEPAYKALGIEPVKHFEDVVRKASYYACDHSSTQYEWIALGRPLIILDRKKGDQFRSSGLRYRYHEDIGPLAKLDNLEYVLTESLNNRYRYDSQMEEATRDLYPYLGKSVDRTLSIIRGYDG